MSSSRPQQQQGVFVDCVGGKHASTGVELLLEKRRLIWRKDYGWTWDAWVDDPAQYALSGAHGRFSLQGIMSSAGKQLQHAVQHGKKALGVIQHEMQQQQGHWQASNGKQS